MLITMCVTQVGAPQIEAALNSKVPPALLLHRNHQVLMGRSGKYDPRRAVCVLRTVDRRIKVAGGKYHDVR